MLFDERVPWPITQGNPVYDPPSWRIPMWSSILSFRNQTYLIIESILKITSVCGMLIVGEVHVWGKGAYGKSLYFLLSFPGCEPETSLKTKVYFLKSKGKFLKGKTF